MDLGIQGKKAIVCASSKGLGKAFPSPLDEAQTIAFFPCIPRSILKV